MKQTIVGKLENIKSKIDNELIKCVIEDALENNEDAQLWLEDVRQYGCQSGSVSGLIYHDDTKKFFKEYAVEIGEAFFEYKEEFGGCPPINDNINSFDWFAWFGYEWAVCKVLDKLENYEE
ncbi:hypothetical protein M5X00_26410 [Paenibacillus alvei]|uniref:DUF7222 domain-containing protein n=1 Tax=Paenibacillus alvei TaxID=44250 RepID=UPI000288A930|nr:hypothetical protein [Paenibacillus alvei]EJW14064.1 hypothetical protein PAV_141p01700 [Paenibacillus alvei DSM 29]MCY9544884.1 hypothetical protein [Paenibacillus alvei]MCY9707785.1 hypothetical protein [Paenibacillus alvei]MCY9757766.1 hypothetical protein [Paenibacillus alvei]MEC0082703.1 hypothetical protein [Paenibacillus alvei]